MLRPGKIWDRSYTQVLKVSNALNFFVKYWDRYSGDSTQFAIAANKHGLGLLKRKLGLIQPQSYSRQIFILREFSRFFMLEEQQYKTVSSA